MNQQIKIFILSIALLIAYDHVNSQEALKIKDSKISTVIIYNGWAEIKRIFEIEVPLNKIKIERLRIYVQAVNLFTVTKYTGLDPESPGLSQAYGIDFGKYPNNQKQYLIGLNLIF